MCNIDAVESAPHAPEGVANRLFFGAGVRPWDAPVRYRTNAERRNPAVV
jgi:hypothetical protein